MTMGELAEMLKSAGWTIRLRTRRKTGLEYIYAAKRIDGKLRETYIAPQSQIGQLTQQQVQDKLAKIQK